MTTRDVSKHGRASAHRPPRSLFSPWFSHIPVAMMFTFFVGDLPTLYQLWGSIRLNTSFWLVGEAERQLEIYRRNVPDCVGFSNIVKRDSSVTIIECLSGDVLVSFDAADGTWMTRPEKSQAVHASLGIDSALAAQPSSPLVIAQGFEILCQRFVDRSRILRRIRLADGSCADQTINGYTGRVLSHVAGSCDRTC